MNTPMSLKNIKLGFIFQIVAIFSLSIIYIFQWSVMITNPSLRTGTDFMAFYSAGRVAQEYSFTQVYDISLQQKVQEEVLGFALVDTQVLIYIHPPYILPLLFIIITKNYIASFIVWAVLMFLIYTTASWLLIKETKPTENNLFIAVILFFPFFQSLLLGQDTALLLFGTVLWWIGMKKEKDWLAAIGLALTSIRPYFCLALLIALLIYDYQIWWKYITVTGILTLSSILLIGWEGTLDFVNIIQISASGAGHGTNENAMFNLIGFISRSLPFLESNSIRTLGWLGYLIAILFLTFQWKRKDARLDWLIGLTTLFVLFFAPHLHYHDLTLLIIPLVFITTKHKNASKFILGISLALLLLTPLYYVLPYLLYAGLLWWMQKTDTLSGSA